jgi:Xaa-Pro aminopeptidase
MTIAQDKTQQAIELLNEFDIDMWLTFVRESSAGGDPTLALIYGHDLTWQSALIVTRSGERIAIVGRFETDTVHQTGAYDAVIGYDQAISVPLMEAIQRIEPRSIAINTSENDVLADGLTHGMYQLLTRYLEGSPYAGRLVSAELLNAALRGRKSGSEVARMERAIEITSEIYQSTFDALRPGLTEADVAALMHADAESRSLDLAWEQAHCPAVNAGPDTPIGHAAPSDILLQAGQLVHFDFGVRYKGYCSDIQRVVYLLRAGETVAPPEVQRGFDTIVLAIQACVNAMRPGIRGQAIDQIARDVVTDAGYPDFQYATGHQLGQQVHDGAGILGPKWERYGDTPDRLLEPGHVYTVEPGLMVPGYGYIGLEEDVLVTPQGTRFLGPPQKELIVIDRFI